MSNPLEVKSAWGYMKKAQRCRRRGLVACATPSCEGLTDRSDNGSSKIDCQTSATSLFLKLSVNPEF